MVVQVKSWWLRGCEVTTIYRGARLSTRIFSLKLELWRTGQSNPRLNAAVTYNCVCNSLAVSMMLDNCTSSICIIHVQSRYVWCGLFVENTLPRFYFALSFAPSFILSLYFNLSLHHLSLIKFSFLDSNVCGLVFLCLHL